MRLFVDIETYSEADLKSAGLHVYAAHPSTQILVVAWALNDGPVQVACCEGSPPQALLDHLATSCLVHAWNAAFERTLFKHVWDLDIPLDRWRCDMVHSMSLSLPASLGQAGKAISLPPEMLKHTTGTRLIQKFCKPRKPTAGKPWTRSTAASDPEDWIQFVEYCRQDVEAERAIHRRLRRWRMPEQEWSYWRMDQRINETGLPIDRALVKGAMQADTRNRRDMMAEAREITRLGNPNSAQALLRWFAGNGLELPDLTKDTVRKALEQDLAPGVGRVLELRQDLARASVTKYKALDRATSSDHRLRGCLQFYGASRTGRWAGRVFQPQNLPRGSLKPEQLREVVESVRNGADASADELVSCIRSAVRAPEGQLLRVADLANIESRILGWISNSRRMLDCFANDRDIYADFGTELFRCAIEEIDKARRNYSKPPTLGCGYGLGAVGLVAYADGMGQAMTLDQAQQAVDVFRSVYDEVPRLWRLLEQASKELIREGSGATRVGRLRFIMDAPFLFMELPSGRRLAYFMPKVEQKETPWGELADTVTYMGVDQYTRKWTRIGTFGGKWVEQACQAISRDLLAHGLAQAEESGFEVVGHTHDEIIALSDAQDWRDHDVLSWCMVQQPPWGDEKLYLGAEGFSDVIYQKG
jgi:DNA polymerase